MGADAKFLQENLKAREAISLAELSRDDPLTDVVGNYVC